MRFLSSAVVLLAICGLAAAGHLYHHQQHHSQHGGHEEHGSSYAVVSKHEEPAVHEYSHGGSGGGHHEYVHFEHQGGYSSDGGHSEGGHAEGGHDDGGYDAGHDEIHGHEDSHDYHAHPKYEFDYSVKDEKSGDNKNHWETRDGDKVKGKLQLKTHAHKFLPKKLAKK